MCCHHCLLRRLYSGGNTLASVLLALAHLAKRTRRLGAPRRLSSTSFVLTLILWSRTSQPWKLQQPKSSPLSERVLQHLQHLVDPRRGDVVRARARDETTTGDDGLILKSATRARAASVCGFRNCRDLRLHASRRMDRCQRDSTRHRALPRLRHREATAISPREKCAYAGMRRRRGAGSGGRRAPSEPRG